MTHRQLLKALTTTALDSFTTAPYGGGNQLIFCECKSSYLCLQHWQTVDRTVPFNGTYPLRLDLIPSAMFDMTCSK